MHSFTHLNVDNIRRKTQIEGVERDWSREKAEQERFRKVETGITPMKEYYALSW